MNRAVPRPLPYALAFFGSVCIMTLELVAGRLVARHVGASLVVWTSVIGIMLGGICLGNVLGGRLADRAEPRRLVGPFYALSALLCVACLWINAYVGHLPGLDRLPWDLRTLVVVALEFLAPGTMLGMIGPVVAKMAVTQAEKSGSALGDVSFWGAVGSIVGTFLTGFVLIYASPTSTILNLVAAGLALLVAVLGPNLARGFALAGAMGLGFGATRWASHTPTFHGLIFPAIRANLPTHLGHLLITVTAMLAAFELWRALRAGDPAVDHTTESAPIAERRVRLADLSMLAFVGSLGFMSLEMVAGRLVARHLGSSLFGWTSVIGVLLGGLSLGNLLGGSIADRIRKEGQASHLFLVASALTLLVLFTEISPHWIPSGVLSAWDHFDPSRDLVTEHARSAPAWLFHSAQSRGSILGWASGMTALPWWSRVLLVVSAAYLPAAVAMGTVGPVVAKLAVDRVHGAGRTGATIGAVYAWGMVGSLLGTFLVGFLLIDHLGTKGVLLTLAATLGVAAAWLGHAGHAAFAGIPLGLCLVAFVPVPFLTTRAVNYGLIEPLNQPNTEENDVPAYSDESNYYYIRVDNHREDHLDKPQTPPGRLRTLILDALIHGHDRIGHPEDLEYDYEFLYADATDRFLRARSSGGDHSPPRTMFLGGGSYTFPRYLQKLYPGTTADVSEIDPAVTRANHIALGLSRDTPIRTTWGDARQFVQKRQGKVRYDLIFGDAFNDFSIPWHLTTREFNDQIANLLAPDGLYMINIIDLYESDAEAESRAEQLIATRERAQAGTGLTDEARTRIRDETIAEARSTGAFLGAWLKTARHSFPHLYVFGTHSYPGYGTRETFVVIAAKRPLDLTNLGGERGDPKFFPGGDLFAREPFPEADLQALDLRSRGIELTDDYAPVENLLAPVAATRAQDD